MKHALIRWFVLTVAVWIAASVVPGISCDNWKDLLVAALVLGILNSFVKPFLQLLSLPFIIVSFGLFLVVINALLLKLTTWFVDGFRVKGFWAAAFGSIVISIVSMFLGYSKPRRRVVIDRSDNNDDSEHRGPPPGTGRIIDVE